MKRYYWDDSWLVQAINIADRKVKKLVKYQEIKWKDYLIIEKDGTLGVYMMTKVN